MKLEDQVCALEYSKRLAELGVKQDSLFCYQPILNDKPSVWPRKFNLNEFAHSSIDERIAAFTAAELGEILPNGVNTPTGAPFDYFRLFIERFCSVDEQGNITRNYTVNYECDSTPAGGVESWLRRRLTGNRYDPNLSNALSMMLIFLLENKLIEFPE